MNSDIHFWIHNKPTSSGKTKAVCHECQGGGGPGVGEVVAVVVRVVGMVGVVAAAQGMVLMKMTIEVMRTEVDIYEITRDTT